MVAVASGGAIGSVLRYLATMAMTQRWGPGFPYGTLFVNLTGSLVIGVIAELLQTRAIDASPAVRLFLIVGVLGGYTTFSSFAYDNLILLQDGVPWTALAYAMGSVVAGTTAALTGMLLVRLLP